MEKKVDTEAQKTPQVPQKKIVEVYVDTTWCQHGDSLELITYESYFKY